MTVAKATYNGGKAVKPQVTVKLDGTTLTPEVLNRYTAATATVKVNIGKNAAVR